jgi:hypothetical protein
MFFLQQKKYKNQKEELIKSKGGIQIINKIKGRGPGEP